MRAPLFVAGICSQPSSLLSLWLVIINLCYWAAPLQAHSTSAHETARFCRCLAWPPAESWLGGGTVSSAPAFLPLWHGVGEQGMYVLLWRKGYSITKHRPLSLSTLAIVQRGRETKESFQDSSACLCCLFMEWGEGLLHCKTTLYLPLHACDCAERKREKLRNLYCKIPPFFFSLPLCMITGMEHLAMEEGVLHHETATADACGLGNTREGQRKCMFIMSWCTLRNWRTIRRMVFRTEMQCVWSWKELKFNTK